MTTWTYSPTRGWLTDKAYDGGSAGPHYEYTPAGRPESRTWVRLTADETALTTTYLYSDFGDPAGTSYTDATPAVSIHHDRRGRPDVIRDAAGERALSYHDAGRLLGELIVADGATGHNLLAGVQVTHTYSPSGLRTNLQTHAGAYSKLVGFEHDSSWRLSGVKKDGLLLRWDYDERTGLAENGQYFNLLAGPGSEVLVAEVTREYDMLGRMKSIEAERVPPPPSVSPILMSYGYTYDPHGRRSEMSTADGRTWVFTHDDMGQLTSAKRSFSDGVYVPGAQYWYNYDDVGNRVSVEEGGDDLGQSTYTSQYTSNGLNQYLDREVPGYAEVAGHSPALVVNVGVQEGEGNSDDQPAWRHGDGGFYHRRLGPLDNSSDPWLGQVNIQELGGGAGLWSYPLFMAKTPEEFAHDADGNLTLDGVWEYRWDAENRLRAMQMRPEVALVRFGQVGSWVRLEFAYDYMGRRISKKFLKSGDTPPTVITGKDDTTVSWSTSQWTKFVYDSGGWNLSVSYFADQQTGAVFALDQSFAWGADLSGTESGAGGIGGLAVYSDDFTGTGNPGPMFPAYDGNGNITRLYKVLGGVAE